MNRNITLAVGCLLAGAGFAAAPEATVGTAVRPPVIDGRLDDACWKDVTWLGDFGRLGAFKKTLLPPPKTEFAFASDARNLYFAARCHDPNIDFVKGYRCTPVWFGNNIELFLSPSGTTDDFYQFSVSPNTDHALARYYAEAGGIEPDPYAPVWQRACGFDGDAWTLEIAIPYSAFYMTRNAQWSTTWIANVARTFRNPAYSLASWASLEVSFHEPRHFRKIAGFPQRLPADDVAVRSAVAEMKEPVADGLAGDLALDIFAATAGEYEITTSSGAKERVMLKAGDNDVTVPCRYRENGRPVTHIAIRNLADGTVAERDYPVVVDYRPVRVKFSLPQYRDCFYPGQDASSVRGRLSVAGGIKARLTLEGPGFPTRKTEIDGEGEFVFDTEGFEKGEAWLTVDAGKTKERFRIRNLPDTGRRMIWIENGNLVVNGRPTIRRNIYASHYSVGRDQLSRFEAEIDSFALTPEFDSVTIEYRRIMKGGAANEGKECARDDKPDPTYLAKIRDVVEENRIRDFGCYYICDEPECRSISPIWLRKVYEYVIELDPYHPVFLSSRGGKTYVECADWLETHPYLNCGRAEDGRRRYGRHPREVGRFIDAFGLANRPDKCAGFLPTCFAYRGDAFSNDYPTLEEYVLHLWSGLMHGAKSLWPYAGHDMSDRASTYNGVRYGFQSVAALEDFLALAKRTKLDLPEDFEGMVFDRADGEKLLVVVNFASYARDVVLSGVTGSFREFRGCRTFDGAVDATLTLGPLGTFVATTKPCDAGLEPYAAVKARVDLEEAKRTGRDNQLRGRYETTTFKSNMRRRHGGDYKLIDGTLNVETRLYSGNEPTWLEIVCRGYAPTFDRLLVWGYGVKDVTASVFEDGVWKPLKAKVSHDGIRTEIVFDAVRTADCVRLDFPADDRRRVDFELYEIELPHVVMQR